MPSPAGDELFGEMISDRYTAEFTGSSFIVLIHESCTDKELQGTCDGAPGRHTDPEALLFSEYNRGESPATEIDDD